MHKGTANKNEFTDVVREVVPTVQGARLLDLEALSLMVQHPRNPLRAKEHATTPLKAMRGGNFVTSERATPSVDMKTLLRLPFGLCLAAHFRAETDFLAGHRHPGIISLIG